MLNNIVSTYKMKRISCKFPKYPYLCIVFFIVLDLRLTKVGARRCSFFYAYIFGFLKKNGIFVESQLLSGT